MEIVIHSLGLPFARDTLEKEGLGGSESAAYYKAVELARRGHRVKVFTTHPDSEADYIDNIQFINVGQITQQTPLGDRFEHYTRNTQHDVLIIQRQPHAFHAPFAAKVCIHEHHDLALGRYGPMVMAGAWQVGKFTAVSDWHRQQMLDVYGLNPSAVAVVPNGVDSSLYDAAKELDVDPFLELNAKFGREHKEGELRLIYQSRPERGLAHLVKPGGIMDRLREKLPNAVLYVFGYENTTPQMAPHYQQWWQWADQLPNVVRVGAVTKQELAGYQCFADLLLYPTEFEEVSCITAMEAMHAGLPILSSACGALPETCADSGSILLPLAGVNGSKHVDEDAFVERLQSLLGGDLSQLEALQAKQLKAAEAKTWAASVDALEAAIEPLFNASTAAVLRTAVEKSDIRFAQKVLEQLTPEQVASDPIVATTAKELDTLYAFQQSDEAYAAHYAKHQGRYYDEHDVIGENVTNTTRFKGVYLLLEQVAKAKNAPMRVLDYGCAHGHYSMPLAKVFRHCQFIGVDVSKRAVEAFNTWVERDKLDNAVAHQLDGFSVEPGEFDVIIAGEVLEHVRDPYALLEQFRGWLNKDGVLILTTPVGRWEHSGTKEFRKAREHMEHFDRADLEEIFAGHEVKILSAPAGQDRSGVNLGSYVAAIGFVEGRPIGRPDFTRKLMGYRPRETISACLIVKDGEATLQKAIESVIDWVDEVIVVIDAATEDGTEGVLQTLKAKYWQRPFTIIKSEHTAVKDGFSVLRNESIAPAVGDWILWFDADEEVKRPWNLHRLARPSMHQAYGFRQVHYSVDPSQVLSTDMPCRFFRNHRGVKFYGLVHEHPEDAMGKGIPYAIVRPEVEFLHAGYVDEETRRARFRRNYPLVLRDHKENPARKINSFLILRDLAQGIVFEREQLGGGLAPHHLEQAKEGIQMFADMLANKGGHIQNRMLVDCLPYYSACVETLNVGFDAEFTAKLRTDAAPDLAQEVTATGRFHDRQFFQSFIASIFEEATAKYESRYL